MIIKGLTLENFKGIKDPIHIDLKPVTLLFGANSAGKSTILQALVYAREVLERHNLDPDRTVLGGEWMDLGGFHSLVHNHNYDKPIKIGFELDLSEVGVPDYLSDADNYMLENREWLYTPDNWLSNIQQASFLISITWSERLNKPIISRVEIEINYCLLAELVSSLDGKNIEIQFLNTGHHIFEHFDGLTWFTEDLLPDVFDSQLGARELQISDAAKQYYADLNSNIDDNDLQKDIKEDIDGIFSAADLIKELGQEKDLNLTIGYTNMGLLGQQDALPVRGSRLQFDRNIFVSQKERSGPGYEHPLAAETIVSSVLSGLIVGPLDQVCSELDNLLYIGPFREVPKRNHDILRSPDLSRWARGLAAWDILMTDENKLVEKVNVWLGSKGKFDSQYEIVTNNYKLVDMNGPLYRRLQEDSYIDEELLRDLLNEYISEAEERSELKILARDSGTKLEAADLGVGISQVLPVIVAALNTKRGVISVEQPELHIHPAWQVVLGDLFATEIQERDLMFLIETHSEHLMLRLLRRIRETNDNELPPGAPKLTPEDVAVIYVQNTENGVDISSLKIDEDGEFIDRWPKGFFEERAEELF